eukprot:SAG31_NODE_42936_length_269_cov_0.900000_1_plen_62_part_10
MQLLDVLSPEATELMEQLRAGGISIGDRSKVRLLLGDRSSRYGNLGAIDEWSSTPMASSLGP